MKQTKSGNSIENLDGDIIDEIVVSVRTFRTKQFASQSTQPIMGIRSSELLERLKANRKENHNPSFSPTTLDKYLKVLVREEYLRRHAKSHKTVFYELNETKIKELEKRAEKLRISGSTLEDLGRFVFKLNSFNEKPFFGLVGGTQEKKDAVERLMFIRDTCRKIANQLDLLNLPEVKS
ncbi:MAG: hypothetical protein ACE14S_07915 [Candidatus Bathyarchaeia archaeon]